MNSGVRVSIPNSVRKTIQNLKEITGNHSEDEIYAMLKECSMDPNETAQKLLLQDPFHEVRRKRDRKKENPIKESTEPRWKPGMQGRGNRGGRGNYSSRRISQDAGGSRNALSAKENGINQVADDDVIPPKPHDTKNKDTSVPSVVTSSPSDMIAKNTNTVSVASDTDQSEVTSKTSSPSPGVYLSASDPILMPSKDSRLLVDTIRREIGSQRTPVEQVKEPPIEIKTASTMKAGPEGGSSLVQEGTNLLTESSRSAPSTHNSSSIGRPPSNYNNRSQQAIGFQKVGPVKEWKPKPTNPILAQGPGPRDLIEVQAIPVEAHSPLQPASSIPDSKDNATSEKEKQDESHISDGQHVIIPNHLHVPEAEKLGFRFGSFDASFGYNSGTLSAPLSDKSSSPSEASEGIDEHIEEPSSRNQDVLVTADDGDYADRPPSSSNVPENLSAEGDVSSSVATEYTESKQETSLPTAGHQYPVVQASPNLSFGFMPPIIGSHLAPFESSGSQVRDASRVPGFVVQQPFDPASYYAQFYRSGADSDGRISPFHSPGVATKYNGNVAVLSPQASQSSQEVGNSLILSTASPTPSAATQTAGVMQSSIAVTQQPLPVFRQPAGLHLPHYPPNYIPYGPYFSPFYIPPPAIHQFLSNGTFPQQPQAGGIYPAPPVATAKYPLPQYKPGSNTGPGHVGMAGTYGPYGSNPAGYNPSSGATAGKSTSHEDHNAAHFKENNVYVTGQQSEGSGVWIAAPGQDISGSFYNLPQGSQVAYTPTQPGHGPFANIYHPAQPVTTGPVHPLLQQSQTMTGGVEMVGPTSSVYPQPQPTQINWPNNY